MRIAHVTSSLLSEQRAAAMLPACLAHWSASSGHDVSIAAYESDEGGPASPPDREPVRVVPVRPPRWPDGPAGALTRTAAFSALARAVLPAIREADVVHVHGHGPLSLAGGLVAHVLRRPVVLTLYGAEIWDYRPRRLPVDLFARLYRRASHVVFCSHGLLTHAMALGLGRRDSSVIYPPIGPEFTYGDRGAQADARAALNLRSRHLLVTVKRVDALGGHRVLLEALSEIIRTHPDTRLVIVGTGPLLADAKAAARSWGVEGHVTFTGPLAPAAVARYDAAADAFVVPSRLDSCPMSALEALACGTPVVATDNPGGLELRELFGFDVTIVPRDQPVALARAIVHLFEAQRRVRASTVELLEREFRPAEFAAQYQSIYERALTRTRRSRRRTHAEIDG